MIDHVPEAKKAKKLGSLVTAHSSQDPVWDAGMECISPSLKYTPSRIPNWAQRCSDGAYMTMQAGHGRLHSPDGSACPGRQDKPLPWLVMPTGRMALSPEPRHIVRDPHADEEDSRGTLASLKW